MAVSKRHDDDGLMCSADFTLKWYMPDSILWYMSPWAAQTLLWLKSTGRRVQSWLLPSPHWTGRGVETPALLPSILGGSKGRCSHRRQWELWELQAVRWRNRWCPYIALGKVHPGNSCIPKPSSCTLGWPSLNEWFMWCWGTELLSQLGYLLGFFI